MYHNILYKMGPGSSRVSVGLRNLSAKPITIPLQSVVGQLQQATIQKVQTSGNKQGSNNKGGPGF